MLLPLRITVPEPAVIVTDLPVELLMRGPLKVKTEFELLVIPNPLVTLFALTVPESVRSSWVVPVLA